MIQDRSATSAALELVLAIGIIVGYAVVLRYAYTYTGANDFYIPWRAAQASFWEGQNPYGAETTADIQETLFGRALAPSEHQFDFAYPYTISLLLLPYTLFSYEWAQPLWQATIHVLLVAGLLLWLQVLRRRGNIVSSIRRTIGIAVVILWCLTLYPAVRAFYLGQIALLVFGAVAAAIWALHRRHDTTAGAALAVATVKPQLSVLIVPLLLGLAWYKGRKNVIKGFVGVLGGLIILSLLVMPSWPLVFVQRLGEYQQYTSIGAATDSPSPLNLLLRPLGTAALPMSIALGIGFVVVILRNAWQQRYQPDWLQIGSVTLVTSAWIAPRTATTDQTILLLPLLYLLRRHSQMTSILIGGTLWIGLWALFLATVQGSQEQLVMRLPFPMIALGLWLWNHFRNGYAP